MREANDWRREILNREGKGWVIDTLPNDPLITPDQIQIHHAAVIQVPTEQGSEFRTLY